MRNVIICVICVFLIAGCVKEKNNIPLPQQELPKEEKPLLEENNNSKNELTEKELEKKVIVKTNEIVYKVIPSSIEVFTYKGKYNRKSFDDTKLINPFYKKVKTLKIERIYESKNGEKYGKLSGEHLFVSMDDIKLK